MKSIWRTIGKIIFRTFLVLFTTVLLLVGGVLGLVYTFNYGPSPSARALFVSSVLETSAAGFLATWFLPAEEVETILATNTLSEFDVVTNPNLITIPEKTSETVSNTEEKEIEFVKVSGLTYVGNMMIVKDPSRVFVGTCKHFNEIEEMGDKLGEMIEQNDAIAGINGGGFYDPNGYGTGSVPDGFVFSKGEFLYSSTKWDELLIGFDADHKLIVGEMTAEEAQEMGIRDALTFGPALVVNGEPADVSGYGSGLNPRTAIGQRADGAVLMLVIDGRQTNSLGASYSDLIEVMLEFGAINAANLDGGNSSLMIYDGQAISKSNRLLGDREMPTCFLVERRPSDEEEQN